MRKPTRPGKLSSWLLFTLTMCLSTLSLAKAEATQPLAPGNYCPGTNIMLIMAEDISTSLSFVMQSRAAQTKGDQAQMLSQLRAAGVVLKQATSRGAGARTALLIDSTILSRVNENNDQLLTWFPLLKSALLTLPPDDQAANAAAEAVGEAEDILQDDARGNALDKLKKASHLLVCDDLNIPLAAAIKEQTLLWSRIQQQKPVVTKDYDKLVDSLRTALSYLLNHSQM